MSINSGIRVQATYKATQISRFAGNPFIEALPSLPKKRSDFLLNLANYPPLPPEKLRQADEVTRLFELQSIGDIVYPFPIYETPALTLAMMLRESYVSRNPLTTIDLQRRHALISESKDGVPFPRNWKSSGRGYSIIANTGMGKTTFIEAFLLGYPQIIKHSSYNGEMLDCSQLVYIGLQVPHDATLRGFCLSFFSEIDELLGTAYRQQANSIRTIAPMVALMKRVISACSIGLIIVDEIQNLRLAPRFGSSIMLNLFSELIERVGVSIVIVGTPAVAKVLKQNALSARKLASAGSFPFAEMKKRSAEWKAFSKTLWEFRYTKKKGPLTRQIRNAWHDCSAGNTGFAILAYWLAQRREIGGREQIDADTFESVSHFEMATLQPAIAFLRSPHRNDEGQFEDLLFATEYKDLCDTFASAESPEMGDFYAEEFDDSADSAPTESKSRSKAWRAAPTPDLPSEQPLKNG